MTFDEVLASVLALVGRRVSVHAFDVADVPHLVVSFSGRVRDGLPLGGDEGSGAEAIAVAVDAGKDGGVVRLDRELYVDARQDEDGSLTIRVGAVEVSFSPYEVD